MSEQSAVAFDLCVPIHSAPIAHACFQCNAMPKCSMCCMSTYTVYSLPCAFCEAQHVKFTPTPVVSLLPCVRVAGRAYSLLFTFCSFWQACICEAAGRASEFAFELQHPAFSKLAFCEAVGRTPKNHEAVGRVIGEKERARSPAATECPLVNVKASNRTTGCFTRIG